MSLQYPTMQEAVYLCNGAVSEKSQIFRSPLPAEYVTGRTDAPEMRCDHTHAEDLGATRARILKSARATCNLCGNYYSMVTLMDETMEKGIYIPYAIKCGIC